MIPEQHVADRPVMRDLEARLELMGEEERQRVVCEWNDTRAPLPEVLTLRVPDPPLVIPLRAATLPLAQPLGVAVPPEAQPDTLRVAVPPTEGVTEALPLLLCVPLPVPPEGEAQGEGEGEAAPEGEPQGEGVAPPPDALRSALPMAPPPLPAGEPVPLPVAQALALPDRGALLLLPALPLGGASLGLPVPLPEREAQPEAEGGGLPVLEPHALPVALQDATPAAPAPVVMHCR
jgi:hypothetical protein